MLRKGVGSEKVKANLKRMKGKGRDDSRSAKHNVKNYNTNYVGARTATLPDTVKLEATSDKSLQEQLKEVMAANNAKLIDLFREWDDDGNGALDKKEMRKAVAALGYDAPRKDIDAIFDSLDTDNSGMIEFHELKAALSEKAAKRAKTTVEQSQRFGSDTSCGTKSGPSCPFLFLHSSEELSSAPSGVEWCELCRLFQPHYAIFPYVFVLGGAGVRGFLHL